MAERHGGYKWGVDPITTYVDPSCAPILQVMNVLLVPYLWAIPYFQVEGAGAAWGWFLGCGKCLPVVVGREGLVQDSRA